MVEEAENIAAGAFTGTKARKSTKSKKSKHSGIGQPEKTVRNVDEIIASLKTQTTKGEVYVTVLLNLIVIIQDVVS